MKNSELMNLVFIRFEERRMDIIKKFNQFQRELDQDLHEFREAYGDAAVKGLGDLSLTLHQPKTTSISDDKTPTKAKSQRKPSRPKRKRQQPQTGERTISSLLDEHVPVAIAAIAQSREEFTARDIHDYLTNVSSLDINYKNVSLYLGRNANTLGLITEKRKVGEPIAKPTNFFRKGRAKTTKKSKGSDRVDWEGKITTALKGLRKGLTYRELKDKLIKAGVPTWKIQGPAFRGALSRMVNQGTINIKDDRYQS